MPLHPIVAIIQGRMSSSRLPGKVLKDLGGEPVLARVVARAKRAQLVDEVLIATTLDTIDDPIAEWCAQAGVACFRGNLYDVLDRYYQAANSVGAATVVRITADCPMIAPEEIDRTIQRFIDSGADFAANRLPPPLIRTTPIGMDSEVVSFAALERAWKEAAQPYEREHVMPYLYDLPGRFRVEVVDREPNLGYLRFTVDTPADLEQARVIYAHFRNRDDFSFDELIAADQAHPEWQESVRSVQHKGYKDVDERNAMLPTPDLLTCPLCQSTDNRVFEKPESFGFPLTYYLCHACGFVFQDASTAKAADPSFYEETYRKIYQTTEEPTAKDLRQQRLRAEHLVSFLRANRADHPRRVLDIGASSGLLLETFRDALKTEVVGVEPGKAYRALAEAKGIGMFESVEALRASHPERFSLVSLVHVLEHLEDPVGVLRQIKADLLHHEGWLLLEVPNFYTHDSYELAHLACFTTHTLSETIRKAGFKLVTTKIHGWPRSETLGLYITLLAKPDPLAKADYQVVPEKHVALKRQLGMLKRKVQTKLNPAKAWLPLEDK